MTSSQDNRRITENDLSGDDRTVIVEVPSELGPYRLTKMLGRGGMGEVWQAFDSNLERDVAIKLMRRELLANEEAVKRFLREARAVARLNHPNIVQVYSFGDEQGLIYFVMELVEGDTVGQRIKEISVIPLEESVQILLQSIEGLGYASARGIIHRDIKPSNLMLTPDFRIKIADFGLAKMLESDTHMTAVGTTMGSPNYMSPEQARGEEADHRSDIYALGISFYQMLTGHLPFTALTPLSVLLKQIQEPLPEPDFLKELCDGRVLTVIKKMTDKDPEMRFQTYGGLAAAISELAPDSRQRTSAFVRTESMPTPPGPPAEQESPRPASETQAETISAEISPIPPAAKRKSTLALGVAAAVMGLVAVGAIVYVVLMNRPDANGKEPQTSTRGIKPSGSPAVSTSDGGAEPTPAVQPTPAAVYNIYVTATPTPEPTPVVDAVTPTPLPTPTPTPPPVVASKLILGAERAAPGTPVQVFDELNNMTTLGAGTIVDYLELVTRGDQAMHRIGYQGKTGYVRYAEAQPVYSGAIAGTPPAVAQLTAAPAAIMVKLGLKNGKPDQMIEIYRDEFARRDLEGRALVTGTTLPYMGENSDTYKVQLPDGATGYVLKKMGQIQK